MKEAKRSGKTGPNADLVGAEVGAEDERVKRRMMECEEKTRFQFDNLPYGD